MTFFLKDGPVAPPRRAPRDEASSLVQGLYGGGKKAALETDANFVLYRTKDAVRNERINGALDRLDRAEVWDHLREEGLAPDVPFNETADRLMDSNISYRVPMLKYAQQRAAEDPEAWADNDPSDEAIDAEVNRRLQAEHEDASSLVEMMPRGQVTAEIVGGMAGMTLDVKNLPFMFLGGAGGSVVRVAGREAALNMAAEAAFLPAQFEMAERLDIPDPNIVENLAMAAGAGAVLGGGVEVAGRAWRYLRGRNEVAAPLPGYTDMQTRAMVDATEDILTDGRPAAAERIERVLDSFEKEPPFLQENPVNPERPPIMARPDAPQADVAPAGGPVSPPPGVEAMQGDLLSAADDVERTGPQGKKPLLKAFRRQSYTTVENGQKVKKVSGIGIHPDGPVGQEIKARGITSKTAPSLFSREAGAKNLDNLVASEWEENFPGISRTTGVDNGYLNEAGLIDLIVRDHDGDTSWLQPRADADALRRQADELERGPTQDIEDRRQEPGSTFIDPAKFEERAAFEGEDAGVLIAKEVRAFIDSEYPGILNEREIYEIIAVARQDGGDVDYLVERVLEREIDYGTRTEPVPESDIPFGDEPTPDAGRAPDPAGAGGTAGGQPAAGPSAGVGAGAGGIPEASVQFEQTAIGDQALVPGVDPVTQRERLQADMDRPMQGGAAPADTGLFDTGARLQGDMFDPDSPDFTARLEAETEYLRTEVDAGDYDVPIKMDDGSEFKNASDVLKYLDDGDEFAEIIALCGKKPIGDGA